MFGWFRKQEKIKDPKYAYYDDLCCAITKTCHSFKVEHMYMSDRTYIMPIKKDLVKMVFKYPVKSYVPELFDCDDHALSLHAFVTCERYNQYIKNKISDNFMFPWAFGQIWFKENMHSQSHAKNICLTCDRGLVTIEPQNREIRPLTKVYSIQMVKI